MPRAPRICGQVGCPEQATTAGRCDAHQREAWAGSDRRDHLPRNWNTLRQRILKRDRWVCQCPGCPRCVGTPCIRHAESADHIGDRDDHSPGNLRAMCWGPGSCHQYRSSRQGQQASQ